MSDSRAWVPDDAIKDLTVRRALQDVEDPIKMSVDIIKEALPLATMSMTHLAVHSPTEAIRFNASRYIMDRALGSSKDLKLPDNTPAWDKIYDAILVEAEDIVKRGE